MSSKIFLGAVGPPPQPPPTGLATRGAAVQLAAVQRLTNMSIEARKSGQTLREHSQTNKTNKHKTTKVTEKPQKRMTGCQSGSPVTGSCDTARGKSRHILRLSEK